MYKSLLNLALFAAPLVSAHGLVSAAAGNLGGKGRGLGVAVGGDNNQGDVTVFKSGAFGSTGAVRPQPTITHLYFHADIDTGWSRGSPN
jgi:hypothetical protein